MNKNRNRRIYGRVSIPREYIDRDAFNEDTELFTASGRWILFNHVQEIYERGDHLVGEPRLFEQVKRFVKLPIYRGA